MGWGIMRAARVPCNPALQKPSGWSKTLAMVPKSPLDDPETASNAWARFRRLVIIMVCTSFLAVAVGLGGLRYAIGPIPLHMIIATSLGIFVSVMLGSVLMSLVFLSNGTGHDASIINPFEDEDPR